MLTHKQNMIFVQLHFSSYYKLTLVAAQTSVNGRSGLRKSLVAQMGLFSEQTAWQSSGSNLSVLSLDQLTKSPAASK
jgi:hypothetical protein